MKERILDFLIKLANEKDAKLSKQVREKTGLSDELILRNSKKVIERILHQYTQFSVSTIDAFFQKIVKSFAKELGLLGNYKVELDQDKIKNEVIDQVIEDLKQDERMTGWLVEFAFSKVDEHRSWNIRPDVETLANELFKESFKRIEGDIASHVGKELKSFLDKIVSVRHSFESHMKTEAKKALDLIRKRELSIDDFAHKIGGPAGYFIKIVEQGKYEPQGRLLAAIVDPEKWATKSSPVKDEILSLVNEHLNELTGNLVAFYEDGICEYASVKEVLRNFYVYGILSEIQKKLKQYRRENDVMLISDIPLFLNGIIAENEAPFIYEKTGSWFQHYLMDEFQDTSGFQWQNFKPLVENGLSSGYLSLLVGDGKQSIYRWRGGDWNLILHKVKDELNAIVSEHNLGTNWRSAAEVVKFNNGFFKNVPKMVIKEIDAKIHDSALSQEEKAKLLVIAQNVEKLYQDVNQELGNRKSDASGRVVINVYQKNPDIKWKDEVLERLPQQIEELQDVGIEPKDIAILVRRSVEGRQVIEHLVKHKNSPEAKQGYSYNAISNESLFLKNSVAVRVIINTLKYCLNREDNIALAELTYNYHCLQNGDEAAGFGHEDWVNLNLLPEEFSEHIDSILQLPAYELVERIIQLFKLGQYGQKEYLQALQDTILTFFSTENKDLRDYIQWWEEQGQRTSIQVPGSENAISVLTIHKSKGLEFRAVLIPFCDWKLDHDSTKQNIIWCKSDQKPFDEIGYLPLKYSSSLSGSYFAEDYFNEMIKAHIDNINLLYVALTRAEEFLIVNCPPPSDKLSAAGNLISSWLNNEEDHKLQSGFQLENEDGIVQTYGFGQLQEKEKIPITQPDSSLDTPYISGDWRSKIWIKKHADSMIREKTSQTRSSINYGLIAHEILAAIQYINQVDSEIERYFQEGRISHQDKDNLHDQFDRLFSNPQVREWFDTDLSVKAEVPIIVRKGQPRRPDRVIIREKDAIVIDFKTGATNAAHKRQVLEYQQLLVDMGYRDVQAYLLYIGTNTVVQVA